jgi:hypothetical protein
MKMEAVRSSERQSTSTAGLLYGVTFQKIMIAVRGWYLITIITINIIY